MKIVVGGQVDKREIADLVMTLAGDKAEVTVLDDIQAAMRVKDGQADVYLGACHTGGGGALSMAIALLGMDACATLSLPGSLKSEADIAAEAAAGKKAFGFTAQSIDNVVPALVRALLARRDG